MSDKPQYKAFVGPLDPVMPSGDYLTIERLGRDLSPNRSISLVYDVICDEAQKISAKGSARQPEMTQDLMSSALAGLDRCFSRLASEATTRANRIFGATFGKHPDYLFADYPIRWPGENREALNIVLAFVSAAHQSCFVKSNMVPRGVFDDHARIIVQPLFDLKAELMRRWFGIEVKGDISPDELDAMFRGSNLSPPLQISLTDERDRGTDQVAEDARALGHESAHVPTTETMDAATTGIEVFTWVPKPAHWATFGELLKRHEIDGPTQTPSQPFPFSTTTIGGVGSSAATPGGTAGGVTTPAATP